MLRFFQSAYLTRYLVIVFLAAIYWLPSFLVETNYTGESLPVFKATLWATGNNYYVALSLGILITLFSALALNHLCSETGISERVSTLGGFLFIVLASSGSQFNTLSPFILSTFLLLLLIRLLYALPNSTNQISIAYNSGFLVGLAALLYTQIAFLILVIWIALFIHRSGTWRNYIVSVLGLLTPFLFISVWYFWTDQLDEFINLWPGLIEFGGFYLFADLNYLDLVISIVLFVFMLFAMIKVLASLREKSINLRRNLMITFYFFVVVFLMVFISGQTLGMQLFVLPSSILLVQALNKPSKERLINGIISLLLLLIFVNQYIKLGILF